MFITESGKCFTIEMKQGKSVLSEVCIPIEISSVKSSIDNETIVFATNTNTYDLFLTKSGKCFVTKNINFISKFTSNVRLTDFSMFYEFFIANETITFVTGTLHHILMLTKSHKCFVMGSNYWDNWDLVITLKCIQVPLNFASKMSFSKLLSL